MSINIIKNQISTHLDGGQAFLPLQELLPEIPFSKIHIRPSRLPYSIYEVFYHLVFAQKDILDYCTKEHYKAAAWPEDYWPESQKPDSREDWEALKDQFFNDREALKTFMNSEGNALDDVIQHSLDHTILRQVMLVIEHNAYHTGQLLVLCRLLEIYDN